MLGHTSRRNRRLNASRIKKAAEIQLCLIDPRYDFWLVSVPVSTNVCDHTDVRGKCKALRLYASKINAALQPN